MILNSTDQPSPPVCSQLGAVSAAIATMRGPDSDREAIRTLRAALIRQIASDLDTIGRLDAITARLAQR